MSTLHLHASASGIRFTQAIALLNELIVQNCLPIKIALVLFSAGDYWKLLRYYRYNGRRLFNPTRAGSVTAMGRTGICAMWRKIRIHDRPAESVALRVDGGAGRPAKHKTRNGEDETSGIHGCLAKAGNSVVMQSPTRIPSDADRPSCNSRQALARRTPAMRNGTIREYTAITLACSSRNTTSMGKRMNAV
jgi:hypothetical protein